MKIKIATHCGMLKNVLRINVFYKIEFFDKKTLVVKDYYYPRSDQGWVFFESYDNKTVHTIGFLIAFWERNDLRRCVGNTARDSSG